MHKYLLENLKSEHDFLVAIDSDGSVFDTMELKHKKCFIPNTIKHWDLQVVAKYTRETAEFVNLYSKWRGINRWPALMMVFDLLSSRFEVQAYGFVPPHVPQIRAFIANEDFNKSNDGLKTYMKKNSAPELDKAWAWTTDINSAIAKFVCGVPPFPNVRDSLRLIGEKADTIVISSTPIKALTREWKEHGINHFVSSIGGQEMGNKVFQIRSVINKYRPNHVLMIGDAPSDMKAAHINSALFYPIIPGREVESWERFCDEAFNKFIGGEYAGEYEMALTSDFEKALPEIPPWE